MTPMQLWAALGALLALLGTGAAGDDGSYRLPLQAAPLAYEVALVPHLSDAGDRSFTFDGRVLITARALRPARTITLHAKGIAIEEIAVSDLEVLSYDLQTTRDFLTINLNKELTPGDLYNISIRYQGQLGNNRAGFYRSSYKTSDGQTRWLATTQFEATDARRAFPCFDEPALKATFVIRIAPPPGLHAVSNMPVASITGPDPDTGYRYWYNFQRSVVMSSYLVAFVVSDFAIVENGPFRILGRPEAIDLSRYPLSVSPAILEVMVNLTGVDYSLSKMDQVAVPDFAAGAMENWGLVTYRQGYLLLNPDSTSTRRTAATIIAHEFAHQWFGNLVSPDWWTFTWLNEAFASFFEYFDTNKVEPDWNLLTSIVTSMQHSVMRTDARQTTHAITRYVETPSQISSSFDSITYSKGGSLVKMVYHFLTEPTFFKGLNKYLNKKAFDAAVADDLFDAWQEAAAEDGALPGDLTVNAIMDTWTLQAGYPVLTVTRDYAAGTATVSQRRFVSSGAAGAERWFVPISYTTRSERNFDATAPRLWLSPDDESVTLRGLAADDWLVLNIQDAAFYRVNYDSKNWELLLAAVSEPDFDGIHLLNRAQILDDASQLGVSRLLSADTALDAVRAMRHERVSAMHHAILRHVSYLYDRLANTPHFSALQGALSYIVEGWASSERNAASNADDEVMDWTYALSAVPSRLDLLRVAEESGRRASPALLCASVAASARAFDAVWARYQGAAATAERRDALAALGCARDAQRLLAAAAGDAADAERVRPEDRVAALAAPCGSGGRAGVGGGGARACQQAVEFVAKNARRSDTFEDVDDLLSLLRRLADRVRTEEQYQMLEFAASEVGRSHPEEAVERALFGALEAARAQVEWAAAGEGAAVVAWLRRHQSDARVRLSEEEL